jgi:peroxiredoxin
VVVDPVAVNADLSRDAGLGYPILSDPDFRLIDAYGLRHREGHDGGDIALSASVLIDGGGIVRWTYVTSNVRIRPTPDDVLAAVDRLERDPPSRP